MKKTAIVPTWGMHNSTNLYVLFVDDYFGYFESAQERDFYHKMASDQFELYHGCINTLDPNTPMCYNIDGEPSVDVAEYQPIDIINYVKTKIARTRARLSRKKCDKLALNNLPCRFAGYKKQDKYLFDDLDLRPVDAIWRTTVHGVDYDKYNYDD